MALANNESFFLHAVREGASLRDVPSWYQASKEFVLVAVENDGSALQWATERLCADPVVGRAAAAHPRFDCLCFVAPALADDAEIVHLALQAGATDTLLFASDRLRADCDTVRIAVTHNGMALQHALPPAKTDLAIQRLACATSGMALGFVPESVVYADDELVATAVRQNGLALRYASPRQCSIPELIRVAACGDGRPSPLAYASAVLCRDPAFVLGLLRTAAQPRLYMYDVAWGLLDDEEFIRAAMEVYPGALAAASPEVQDALRDDRALMLRAVHCNGSLLLSAGPELQADKELALAAVHERASAIRYVGPLLQRDIDLAREVVTRMDGLHLLAHFVSWRTWTPWHHDKDLVLTAVAHHGRALSHAAPELQDDAEVVTVAVQQNGMALEFASLALRASRDVVLPAVRQNGRALEFAAEDLCADREIVLAAVHQSGAALTFVSCFLRGDLDVILTALPTLPIHMHFCIQPLPDPVANAVINHIAARGSPEGLRNALADVFEASLQTTIVAARHLAPDARVPVEEVAAMYCHPTSLLGNRDREGFEAWSAHA